jgi:hypothetical protein
MLLLASPALARTALHVIPFPDTPDASPVSHIIFSSLRPADLRTVLVTGSQSGKHQGRLVSLPDDGGTAFIPDQPFTSGEQVSVTAALNSAGAGTASGDPGSAVLRFSFKIALPVSSGAAGASRADSDSASNGSGPVQSFRSAPGLHPPRVTMGSDGDHTSGDIFLTPTLAQQNGLMILDPRGRLVWFHHTGGYAANLQVQSYLHHPVLTWWQGPSFGEGEAVIMSSSYRVVKVLRAAYGYAADVHEFTLTPQGTAFIDVSVPVKANLTGIGGASDGNVWDYEIQELDVRTGQLLWEWHALGHVPVSASYRGQPAGRPPYDYFHLNSIQQLPNGNLLVSARNTWAIYEIDKQTGRVIWSLGGKSSSFKMGRRTNFEWQHDARLSGDTLTLFDDGDEPQEERQSSAKILHLDTSTMTASLVSRYTHSPPLLAAASGSTQILPNHDVMIGWGNQPVFSEYTAGRRQILNGSLPLGEYSYRVFRFPWAAQPATRPSVAEAKQPGGAVKVFVSWNGATQVKDWRVRGGPRRGALKTVAHASRTGFETPIVVTQPPHYLAVQALNARGKVIGTSRLLKG